MDRHIGIIGYLHVAWALHLFIVALIVMLAVGAGGIWSGDIEVFAIAIGVGGAIATLLIILRPPSVDGATGMSLTR